MDDEATPPFRRRRLCLAPGSWRPYVESDWSGCLCMVELGVLELEGMSGRRYRFRQGHVLWLAGLPLRALHNCGPGPTTLVIVSRPDGT